MDRFDVHLVIGQIGTGKTTTTNALRDSLGITPVDRDEIREELGIKVYDPADSGRIDQIVWMRVCEILKSGGSLSLGTASAIKRSRRLSCYDQIQGIADSLGRSVETLLIECVCDPDEARRRIAARSNDSAATNDPADYDKVASVSSPPSREELGVYPSISFVRFNTQLTVVESVVVRSGHEEPLDRVVANLIATKA